MLDEDVVEALWLADENLRVTLEELVTLSGLPPAEIAELVEFGVFQPEGEQTAWRFSGHHIVMARTAFRLRADFGLNVPGIALALTYLDRIRELEQRLKELECGNVKPD
jgi:chaperone modulatory protein CbpM